jgi:cobalamin synthase
MRESDWSSDVCSSDLAAAGYWLAVWFADRNLGGMSGDVSGYGLTIGEAVGAIVLCLL